MTAYFVAWMFWTGVATGSLGLLLLHGITGGGWGIALQKPLRAASLLVPLLAVVGLPVVFTMFPTFALRVILYLLVWSALAFAVVGPLSRVSGRGWREAPGEGPSSGPSGHLLPASGEKALHFLVWFVTSTFAAWDLLMSLHERWSSTLFAPLVIAGWMTAALAFAIVVRHGEEASKLLLVFVLLWGYLAFSQFLIVWMANVPQEAAWYVARSISGWELVMLVIAGGHALAATALLVPFVRRSAGNAIAALVLLMQMLHMVWLTEPRFADGWLLDAVLLALGGVAWLLLWRAALRFTHTATAESSARPATEPRA